jgi:outer membrane protein assembly factor BamB
MNGLSRREFISTAGVLTAGALAGCPADLLSDDEQNRIHEAGRPPSEMATAQFRGGLRRQGVYPDATVPESPEIEWSIPINSGEHTAAKASAVALPDGDLVIPGDDGELRRVGPGGEVRWMAAVSDASRGIHGTPAVANGTVYIGAYDGAIYAYDLATGEQFWRSELGDAIGSSPAYHDGSVYIAVEYYVPSGSMFGLDAVTGEVQWEDDRPTNHPHSTCAIDRETGSLVVGANDGNCYGWSYPDLEHQWTFETEAIGDRSRDIKGPVAVADGSAFFGSWNHHLYRVDLATGTEEWSFEADSLVMTGPSTEPEAGIVYTGSHDSRLYALDMADGTVQWSADTDGQLIGCPTVTSEHVLVGSYDGHCYAVRKETGELAWQVAAHGEVTSTPRVVDGAVYFTDRATEAYLDDTGTATDSTGTATAQAGATSGGQAGHLFKIGPAE